MEKNKLQLGVFSGVQHIYSLCKILTPVHCWSDDHEFPMSPKRILKVDLSYLP